MPEYLDFLDQLPLKSGTHDTIGSAALLSCCSESSCDQ